MCTTKLSLMVAALVLLALGLGPGAQRAYAQDRPLAALEHEAAPPLESPRAETHRASRRASLGFGIAGIVIGAVGVVIGGPTLLIAGTTRTHCEGGWFSSRPRTCTPLPDDAGNLVGGGLSIGLGLVGVITGIVLVATLPRRSGPTLSLGLDTSSASITISGAF